MFQNALQGILCIEWKKKTDIESVFVIYMFDR